MAKIKQYFAPDRRILPDNAGYQAFEVAGRRIGPLYRQAAEDISAAGKLSAQSIEGTSRTLLDMFKLTQPEVRPGRLRSEGGGGGREQRPPSEPKEDKTPTQKAQTDEERNKVYQRIVAASAKTATKTEKTTYDQEAINETAAIATARGFSPDYVSRIAKTHSAAEAAETLNRLTALTKAIAGPQLPTQAYHGKLVTQPEKAAMEAEEMQRAADAAEGKQAMKDAVNPYNISDPLIYQRYVNANNPEDPNLTYNWPPNTPAPGFCSMSCCTSNPKSLISANRNKAE